jgi:hypothetical protein
LDIIDVKAQKDANTDSDHIVVGITLRAKICRVCMTRPEKQRRRLAVERLKFKYVVKQYRNELKSGFQSAHDVQTRCLNELRNSADDPNSKQNQSWKAHCNE